MAYSLTGTHISRVMAGESLANGDDMRIVYWDGNTWTELDRVVGTGSAWNLADTELVFRIPDAITANGGTLTGLYFYFSNPSATNAPDDWDAVYDVGDEFNDGALSAGLIPSTSGASTIQEMGGELEMNAGADVADGNVVALQNALPTDRLFSVDHVVKVISGGGPSNPEAKLLVVAQQPSQPQVAINTDVNDNRRITFHQRADTGTAYLFYEHSINGAMFWNGSQWSTTIGQPTAMALNTYHRIHLISAGAQWQIRIEEMNGNVLTTTDWVNWSDLLDTGADPFWYYWGEPYNNFYFVDVSSDSFLYRKTVDPMPSLSWGPDESLIP
jgi:hypothetical protein